MRTLLTLLLVSELEVGTAKTFLLLNSALFRHVDATDLIDARRVLLFFLEQHKFVVLKDDCF